MFSLHDFVMSALTDACGKEPEYKVRQYALGWYDKSILTNEDMATLDALLCPPLSGDEPDGTDLSE